MWGRRGGGLGGVSPPSQQDDVFRFTDWFIVFSLHALSSTLASYRLALSRLHQVSISS